MSEHYGIIYKIENKINHKVYIGQTIHDFARRYGKNLSQVKNRYLKEDIERYGVDAFDIIEEYDYAESKEDLDNLEISYIKLFDSTDRNKGYNIDHGGHNSLHSEETKERIRQKNLGPNNPQYGKTGKDSPRYSRKTVTCSYCGKKFDKIRAKISRSKHHYCSVECKNKDIVNIINFSDSKVAIKCKVCGKEFYRFPSVLIYENATYCSLDCQREDYKQRFRGENNPNYGGEKQKGGLNGRAIKVRCTDTGELFDCARDADRKYGFRIGSAGAVCRGEQKRTHNLHFEFIK